MSPSFARLRFGAAVVLAFVCGLVFASGFDLTRFGYAQQAGTLGKPTASQVKPVADVSNAFVSIAEHVTPAVVSIQAERDARVTRAPRGGRRVPPGLEDFFNQFDPRQNPQPSEASGSGFIVSKDGYILTNNHVVADADRVTVTLTDHRTFKAKVVGRDPTTDVAVVKIEGSDLPTAALGNDESTRVGEWVLAIGNPLGLNFTVTAGIVSAKGRGSETLPNLAGSPYAIQDFIQTDAAINPGNSGGPLVNIRGEVIGINSMIASSTGYYSGYGFAIPVTLAKTVMDDIIAHGRVRRAALGIQIRDASPEDAAVAGLKESYGVMVGGYSDNESPGKRAGIEPGDVIIAADGKRTDRVSTLQRIIRGHQPGETVTLEAMRYGDKKSFRVKLSEAETDEQVAANDEDSASSSGGTSYDKLGITVEPVTPEVVRARSLGTEERGLRVTDVAAGGAARQRLLENDIILEIVYPGPRRPVHSVSDLQQALSRLKAGDYISLNVLYFPGNAKQTRIVNLRID
jgi:serine protease Do